MSLLFKEGDEDVEENSDSIEELNNPSSDVSKTEQLWEKARGHEPPPNQLPQLMVKPQSKTLPSSNHSVNIDCKIDSELRLIEEKLTHADKLRMSQAPISNDKGPLSSKPFAPPVPPRPVPCNNIGQMKLPISTKSGSPEKKIMLNVNEYLKQESRRGEKASLFDDDD